MVRHLTPSVSIRTIGCVTEQLLVVNNVVGFFVTDCGMALSFALHAQPITKTLRGSMFSSGTNEA